MHCALCRPSVARDREGMVGRGLLSADGYIAGVKSTGCERMARRSSGSNWKEREERRRKEEKTNGRTKKEKMSMQIEREGKGEAR